MKQEESWEMRAQQVLWQVKTGREMLKWSLSFMLLQQVPHQLEIIDSKSRLAGRLSEPRSWRTGGLRPLSCICKCATAAYPAQGRKQQTLGCKTHLFGFFTGDQWMQRAIFLKSSAGLLQPNCKILDFVLCSIRSRRHKGPPAWNEAVIPL